MWITWTAYNLPTFRLSNSVASQSQNESGGIAVNKKCRSGDQTRSACRSASNLNSREYFRLAIWTLNFIKYLNSASLKPAASHATRNWLVEVVLNCHHLHFSKIFDQSPVPWCRHLTAHKQRANPCWWPARGWVRILGIWLSCETCFDFLPWSESRWMAWISCRSYRQNERGRCLLIFTENWPGIFTEIWPV